MPFRFGGSPALAPPCFGGAVAIGGRPLQNHLLAVPLWTDPAKTLVVSLEAEYEFVLEHMNRRMEDGLTCQVVDSGLELVGGGGLPSHSLVLADPMADVARAYGGVASPYRTHKLGGAAFCRAEEAAEAIARCEALGLVHLVQLDFPVNPDDAAVDCDWPFGECLLNVFGSTGSAPRRWAWIWQS